MSRRVHDAVARGYNSASGIIAEKNRRVAASLAHRLAARAGSIDTVDLGVGDGAMLLQLRDLGIPSRMTGLDVSPAMLRIATARVPVDPVEAPAERALQVLPAGAYDLVLAHFIFAYVDRPTLLEQARALLAPRGVLSLVTTTEEGGAPFHAGLQRHFRGARHPLKRAIAWAADRALAGSNVPKSFADLERDIASAGMLVLRRETMCVPVTFAGPDDAYRFGIEEGWAANILDMPGVPLDLARRIAKWGVRQAGYPFNFTHVIEMLEIGAAPIGDAPIPLEPEMPESESTVPLPDFAVSESRS
jgi:SAM-dependent methyltransferase